jgi:hypothetical protein
MLDTIYSTKTNEVKSNTANAFTSTNTYSNSVYFNSILDVRPSQITPSTFRVAIEDIDSPTLPTASAEQFKQVGGLTITQATGTPQTETINYNTDSSIIVNYDIPSNFTKNIICYIPIGIRNTGTAVLSGTAASFTITNLFNTIEAKIYINGTLITTTSNTNILDGNSNTRSSTISYTSTGAKSITLNQYFFNVVIDLEEYFNNDFYVRTNETYTLTIIFKANITNTLEKVSNTGNFTTTINTALIANTSTSTFSASLGANGTATYSPNSNGTNYATASFISQYLSLNSTTGTTYANYLRVNKLFSNGNIDINGNTTINGVTNINGDTTINGTTATIIANTIFGGATNQFGSITIDAGGGDAPLTLGNGASITQTGTAQNKLSNLKIDGGIINQLNSASTNTMVNVQVQTISTISATLTNISQNYSSVKMRNYIFHSRTTTTASGITLSTDTYIDDGQYLYIRKINSGVYTLTLTAGATTSFLNLSNTSVSTIAITGLTGISFVYDKPNKRWIQIM